MHRLVALAYLGNPTGNKIEVNHKDGVKSNNKLDNLEWVTRSENRKHAYRIGLRKPLPSSNIEKASLANNKAVIKYEVSSGRIIGVYQSASALLRISGDTKRTTISYQCNNETMPSKSRYYHRFATKEHVEEAIKGNYYFSNEFSKAKEVLR